MTFARQPGPLAEGRILTRFAHPEPRRQPNPKIHPVFLPFAGCPQRCVFCNQAAQTGHGPEPLETILARTRTELAALPAQAPPVELAFYGGTFTALPAPWPARFLELGAEFKALGRLSRVRCSTRPDALTPALLDDLAARGLDLVELGVQSYADHALSASLRGYDGATALAACDMVKAAGLGLGIQLMPGMPGHTTQDFARDVTTAAALGPEFARLYPCLVLEGTPLAGLWRAGEYTPWPLETAIDALSSALLTLWAAGVPSARIGLAEQEGLGVLAGPRHPALGQMARARALLGHVTGLLPTLQTTADQATADTLYIPRRLQGEALGQKGALAADYAALGLRVAVWDEDDLALAATA